MIALHLSNSNYRLINWLFFGQPPSGMLYQTSRSTFLTSGTRDHGGPHWQRMTYEVAKSGKANARIRHAWTPSQSRADRCPITRTDAGVAIPK
jgi:hypothetical protein